MQEAEHLIAMKMHPQTIIRGWRLAAKTAVEVLTSVAEDHGCDEEQFRKVQLNAIINSL